MSSEAIASIRAAIVADPANRAFVDAGAQPVFTADPRARILVVGQSPGRQAQDNALPWSDASGARLRDWLGVDEPTFRAPDSFAFLSMDFFYPGRGPNGDLPPRPGFAARWHPPILRSMPELRLTLLIGGYAQRHYLGRRGGASLTRTVRDFAEFGPEIIPLVHPSPRNTAWQQRNPWFAAELLPVLRERVAAALAP